MSETQAGAGTMLRLALDATASCSRVGARSSPAHGRPLGAATVDLYPTEEQRLVAAEAINASAAIIALYGRIYDPASIGACR